MTRIAMPAVALAIPALLAQAPAPAAGDCDLGPECKLEVCCGPRFYNPDPRYYGAWETVVPQRNGAAVGKVLGMQVVHAVLLPSGKVLMASGSSWRNRAPVDYYPESDDPTPGKGAFNRYDYPFLEDKLDEYYRVVNNTGIFDPEENTFFRIPSPVPVADPDEALSFSPSDLFCTGHLHLPDGNVLFAGGTEYYFPYRTGFPSSYLFDWKKEAGIPWSTVDWGQLPEPETDPWTFAGFMKRGRWYPHMVPLLDGRLVLFGGFVGFDHGFPVPYQFEINPYVEFFDSYGFDPARPQDAWKAVDTSRLESSPFTQPLEPVCCDLPCEGLCDKLEGRDRGEIGECVERCERDNRFDAFKLYPNNYLLADGRIYMTREGEWVSARTDDTVFMRRTRHTYFLRVEGTVEEPAARFSKGEDRRDFATSYGTSFLDPNTGDISILGGQKASAGTLLPVNSTEPWQFAGGLGSRKIETFRVPRSPDDLGSWARPDPNFLGDRYEDNRTMHYAILLPTRQVLVINGGNYDFYGPIYEPLLLTPGRENGEFQYKKQRMAYAVEPRLYHNTALLLPDARVLVMGGNTARATFRLDGPVTRANPYNPNHPHPNLDLVDLDLYFYRDGQMARGEKGVLTVPTETWVAEVFSPPYLFIDGDRRSAIRDIRRVAERAPLKKKSGKASEEPADAWQIHGKTYYLLRSNATYDVELDGLPAECDGEASLVLAKLASVTHGWDSGQRLIPLEIREARREPPAVRFTMPDRRRANIPPAYYMMFYVDCKGKPSKARFVRFDDHVSSL